MQSYPVRRSVVATNFTRDDHTQKPLLVMLVSSDQILMIGSIAAPNLAFEKSVNYYFTINNRRMV